jgi:hypothetical protein
MVLLNSLKMVFINLTNQHSNNFIKKYIIDNQFEKNGIKHKFKILK